MECVLQCIIPYLAAEIHGCVARSAHGWQGIFLVSDHNQFGLSASQPPLECSTLTYFSTWEQIYPLWFPSWQRWTVQIPRYSEHYTSPKAQFFPYHDYSNRLVPVSGAGHDPKVRDNFPYKNPGLDRYLEGKDILLLTPLGELKEKISPFFHWVLS